jgi:glycosyltransferase involved in cell wall biosynthesis
LLEIALKTYRISPGKVTFIANGIDVNRFQPGRDFELRRSFGIPDNALLFGSSGHLRAEKNLSLLLRAFAQAGIPGARLMLLGEGPCRPELESLAHELSIADRVVFAGHIEDTRPYYAAFDVFVMSSVTEQMPMALLEAMACGLPAVCTSAGDTESILGEPAISKGDLAGYVEALRRIAADPQARAALGAKNRRRAEECYSSNRMVQEYERLYASAATIR